MRPSQVILLALISLHILPTFQLSIAQNAISFSYPHDDSARFLLLGDAVESHELIELTSSKDPDVMGGSAGRFLCGTPIRMVDPQTGQAASFTTSFSFRIYSVNSSYQGDGMAFLIVPDNYTVGSSGDRLGAFTPASGGPNDHTFAVEFDTWQNDDLHDPNGNHIGLDATNITSFLYNNASNVGVQLNDGSVVTAWIKYDGALQNLQIRISVDSIEPIQPLIDAKVSFAGMFNEYMYVGFSGSTGLSNEAHTLMSWTFSSWGLSEPSISSNMGMEASKGKNGTTVALTICLVLVLVVLVFGLLSWKMATAHLCGESYFRRAKYYDSKLSSCASPRPFPYRELYAATRGFSEKQKLGVGSFYKGVLVDSGSVVAVKRVVKEPREGLDEFLCEVHLLSSIPHHNLVPVQGWCLEKGQLLLVYEFIPNESLDNYLFSEDYDVLSWSQRYHIITGLAAGLAHMHEGQHYEANTVDNSHVLSPSKTSQKKKSSEHIALIHRDIKSSNVMLDNNFNARLGDYGLRRLVCGKRKGDAMVLEGTFGYMAPEVVETGKITTKADVFSFGILVLEVACGRRAIHDGDVLLDMVWELERQGHVLNSADKRLKGCFDVNEMECLLHLGLLCTSTDLELRPPMSLVHGILLGDCPLPNLPLSSKQQSPQSLATLHNPDNVRASLQIAIDELLAS
ncbi:hypothetical protein GOP47_0026132 [Adiantum capillus-veneris]|uniref:Protein kinase domain-containing protein n=1 Tax=Adiantum capillus-veneris TaxID=13818 RepID=A0A9D4Z2N1_ADICA|nr:hypothetical protein GOP47_0026132 [Adiantum capillus-veneris]